VESQNPPNPEKVVWIMLDGVGLAPGGPGNPFDASQNDNSSLPALRSLGVSAPSQTRAPGFVAHPVDATLGVPGLPQSGTGQTTLLTGLNAAARLGHHHGPWPGPTLRPLLERSLPVGLGRAGLAVRLANHYPQGYLDALQSGRRRLNAIALAATKGGARLEAGGVPPPLDDPERPGAVPLQTVRGWGRDLAAAPADLTILDAWWSDHLGHHGTLEEAVEHARRLEALLAGVLEARPEGTLVLLTSDHGNFEDTTRRTHTRAPVPLAAVGPGADAFAGVRDLSGVAPALAAALGWPWRPDTGGADTGEPAG
jgi:hypothetical protein